MPQLNFQTLVPISTGEIFISTVEAYNKHRIPQTHLSKTHAFNSLWDKHWSMVARPGISDNLIDAFLALSKEDPSWIKSSSIGNIVKQRSYVRRFLRQSPPNVILVSGGSRLNPYSFHSRREAFSSFICISKEYVDLWTRAVPGSENELALRALLHTCIDHETGHWFFTLKVGPFSARYYDACEIEDATKRDEAMAQIPPDDIQANLMKETPKILQQAWNADETNGEAGNFVEIRSRGGILSYSSSEQKAYMETGPSAKVTLPISYLQVYNQDFENMKQLHGRTLYFTSHPASNLAVRRTMKPLPDFFPRMSSKPSLVYSQQGFSQLSGSHIVEDDSEVDHRPFCTRRKKAAAFGKRLLQAMSM